MSAYRALLLAAATLAFVVVVVGAYVRLSDAGLGCPDWPLCYGRTLPGDELQGAALHKAWKEMAHRYLAGTLGLLILGVFVLSWRRRSSRPLASALLLLVAFQATLGRWTVTLLLKPAVVSAHLLGGMATFALLLWLFLRAGRYAEAPQAAAVRIAALVALLFVFVQIVLGGWVSANYAGLACPDLPLCLGQLAPSMDFASAFHVVRELGYTSEGGLLSREALTAIHWTHRVFALATVAVVGWAAARALRVAPFRRLAALVAFLLALQFLLGVANVALQLPLGLAAAHNAGAALLLAALVVLNFFSFRGLHPHW
jgi:heme a synthase